MPASTLAVWIPAPLTEQFDALGMGAAELARRIKVPTNRVTQILNSQRAMRSLPTLATS